MHMTQVNYAKPRSKANCMGNQAELAASESYEAVLLMGDHKCLKPALIVKAEKQTGLAALAGHLLEHGSGVPAHLLNAPNFRQRSENSSPHYSGSFLSFLSAIANRKLPISPSKRSAAPSVNLANRNDFRRPLRPSPGIGSSSLFCPKRSVCTFEKPDRV